MKHLIEDYARIINLAKEESLKFVNEPDNGSCNLDSVIIFLPRWNKKNIEELSKLICCSIGEKNSNGGRFLHLPLFGQGNRRSTMCEKAQEVMSANGIDCSVWYQLD